MRVSSSWGIKTNWTAVIEQRNIYFLLQVDEKIPNVNKINIKKILYAVDTHSLNDADSSTNMFFFLSSGEVGYGPLQSSDQ